MLDRPTTLSETRVREVENHLRKLETRLERHVEAILDGVESEVLRNQLRSVAFRPNEMLPKRRHRPTLEIEHIAEQLYLAHDPDGRKTDDLLRFTLTVQEYYDIADDLIDGDVAEGSETEVMVTNELLLPHVLRFLGRIEEEAVAYWSQRAFRMVGSFAAELLHAPSAEAYLDLLDRQSELYGAVTGLAAVAAGGSDNCVERAEAVGAAYFKHEQFLLDLEQYERDGPDSWNAWHLLSSDRAAERVHGWQDDVAQLTDDLPAERAELVCPLVAVDVDACLEMHL